MKNHTTYLKPLSTVSSTLRGWLLTLAFALLFVVNPLWGFAQNFYPVHVTVQVMPPHSVYLSDYYSGSRDRLVVILHNRDQQQRPLQVRLRVQVKNGSSFGIQSREELYYPMLTLQYGVPLRLTGADLAPYLTGDKIQLTGYLQQGKLPSGMTEFSVQAVDYLTGRTLSAYGTGRAWLETKQPPMLNLPLRDEQVAHRTPQQIRFQWMPRHQGLANTQYEFFLKELPDNGADPRSAFAYGREIYRSTTRFTTLNYTHLEPALLPGKRYGWQVRAIAKDGIDEIGVFENNGYSEIGWFELNDNCPAPTQVTALGGYRKLTLEWKSTPDQRAFVVEYRPKSAYNFYDWTTVRTLGNSFIAYDLTPGWKYEYRVGALCMTEKPVYSPTGEITLSLDNEERLAKCGQVPQIDLSNQTGKENLQVGEVVIVGGDFPMTVTQVSSQGNGWYAGKGWLTLPWIFETKLAVKFSRLRVNTDNRQIAGEVEGETDPRASQIANTNELDYGGGTTSSARLVLAVQQLNFSLPAAPQASYDPEKGELTIFDTNGTPHQLTPQKNGGESIFPMVVADQAGNKYQFDLPTDEAGAATDNTGKPQSLVVTPIRTIPTNFATDKISTQAGGTIRFSQGNGRYAFDAGNESWYQKAQLIKSYYPPLGNGYVAPWKLIPVGASDEVEATLSGAALARDKILFCLPDGTQVAAREVGEKWLLTLPAVAAGESYSLFALYEAKKGKYETIGKLNVVSYARQEHTVTLVPVDGAIPDLTATEQELNRIYAPYGIRLRLQTDDCLRENSSWDADNDGLLDLTNSGFFTKETKEMRALRNAYRSAPGSRYEKNGYYIFLLNGAKAESEPDQHWVVQGDMPRGKQFGYLFTKEPTNTPRLLAHELGHGIFTLRHSFDVNYAGDAFKGTTSNLMDYARGEELAAWQWNVLANPAPLTWWDDQEDAMSRAAKEKLLALRQRLATLGEDHAIFILKCNSVSDRQDGKCLIVDDFKYYLLKLNTSADGSIRPVIVEQTKESEFKQVSGDLWTLPAVGEAFLVRSTSQEGAVIESLALLDIADYPNACEAETLTAIDQFAEHLKEDIQFMDLEAAVQRQLNNPFFKNVKLCVNLTHGTKSRSLLTTGVNSCEEAELRLDIKIGKDGKINASITPSEDYLAEYVNNLQREADRRGIKTDVEQLRQEVLRDLQSALVDPSFLDQFIQETKAFWSDGVASFVEGVQASQKIAKSIWDTGEINRSLWHSQDGDYSQWPAYCHSDPVVGGFVDGVVDEIVSIPLVIKDLYVLMTDAEQRKALMGVFNKEGMTQMWEALKSEATEILNDSERTEHFGSKTVVQVANMLLTGGTSKAGKLIDKAQLVAKSTLPPGATKVIEKLKTANRYTPERLEQISNFLKKIDQRVLDNLAEVPGFEKVVTDMATSWNKFRGGHFQLRKAERLVKSGKKIKFEVNSQSDEFRRIYDIEYEDVIDGRLTEIRLELKNWSDFYPETIRSQFVKDLGNMSEFSKIEWLFHKTGNVQELKGLQEKVLKALRKADGTPVDEFEKLFEKKVAQVNKDKFRAMFKTDINNASDLLKALELEENFTQIVTIVD